MYWKSIIRWPAENLGSFLKGELHVHRDLIPEPDNKGRVEVEYASYSPYAETKRT